MNFHRIVGADDPLTADFWNLYEGSFPREERRSWDEQVRILSDPAYHCLAVTMPRDCGTERKADDKFETSHEFVGLFCFWLFPDICYLEHLAVHPARRSGGIGGRILQTWLERRAGPERLTVLEIDPPVTDVARRRRGFYERQGFVFNGGEKGLFMHPSFGSVPHYHPLCLMSFGRPMSEADRRVFDDAVLRRVLNYDGPPYQGEIETF